MRRSHRLNIRTSAHHVCIPDLNRHKQSPEHIKSDNGEGVKEIIAQFEAVLKANEVALKVRYSDDEPELGNDQCLLIGSLVALSWWVSLYFPDGVIFLARSVLV